MTSRIRHSQSQGDVRTAVITGASRGLGFASAVELYRRRWRVLAAMRSAAAGLELLREATGARKGDPRLQGIALDLLDPDAVQSAADAILEAGGAPDALVHNAGVAVAGFVEETPAEEWTRVFTTNLFAPAALTNALLPSMRAAGRGRIVIVSSTGAVRGMPLASVYSASKAAAERWAEALAAEVAPYGLGVTILLAGTYRTDITADGAVVYRNRTGPYGMQHPKIERRGRLAVGVANPPERFARALSRALENDRRPIVHRGAGLDAKMFRIVGRVTPSIAMHHLIRIALGQPRFGALRSQR